MLTPTLHVALIAQHCCCGSGDVGDDKVVWLQHKSSLSVITEDKCCRQCNSMDGTDGQSKPNFEHSTAVVRQRSYDPTSLSLPTLSDTTVLQGHSPLEHPFRVHISWAAFWAAICQSPCCLSGKCSVLILLVKTEFLKQKGIQRAFPVLFFSSLNRKHWNLEISSDVFIQVV